MKNILVIVCLLVASPAPCLADERTPANAASSSHQIGLGPANQVISPIIKIRGGSLTVNDKQVFLGDSVEIWSNALGKGARCFQQPASLTTCIWDDAGIEIGTDARDTSKVKFVNIRLKWDSSMAAIETPAWLPRGVFRGHIDLDGFAFDSETEFRRIGQHAHPSREMTCGGRYCGRPWGKLHGGANLYFSLDSGSDRGHVIEVSLACVTVSACADFRLKPRSAAP